MYSCVPGKLYIVCNDIRYVAGPHRLGYRAGTRTLLKGSVLMYVGCDYKLFDRLQVNDLAKDRKNYVGYLKMNYKVFAAVSDARFYYIENDEVLRDLTETRVK